MTEPIKVKVGATFSVPMLVLLPAGTWGAACDIRKGDDTLVGSLTATLEPLETPDADGNTHAGLLQAPSTQTAVWALGTWRADVRFSDNSDPPVVIYTEAFSVTVEKGSTHA